jgi:two-component system sensor histidine kinase CpxA
VEVALRRDGTDHVTVTVHDHGPGVPEESLEALFRPFYRVNPGRDRDSGGVGLGLAIAQRALQIHGATIEARNADGGGLEVTIHLPALATAAGVDRRLTAV